MRPSFVPSSLGLFSFVAIVALAAAVVVDHADAKGLVGKLPGNPASCPEEPCTSDPQHVLRALKHTSYFVGVIFLMPILLYYMSKLFSKMRDCCAPIKPNKSSDSGATNSQANYEVAKSQQSHKQASDLGSLAEQARLSARLSAEIAGNTNGPIGANQAGDRQQQQYKSNPFGGGGGGLKSARTSSSAGTNNSNSIACL